MLENGLRGRQQGHDESPKDERQESVETQTKNSAQHHEHSESENPKRIHGNVANYARSFCQMLLPTSGRTWAAVRWLRKIEISSSILSGGLALLAFLELEMRNSGCKAELSPKSNS